MRDFPEAFCCICGREGPFPPFFPGASMRECRCPGCGSSRRNRDVARVLMDGCLPEARSAAGEDAENLALGNVLRSLASLHIYELQAQGALHSVLGLLPDYVCSEYLRDVPPGERNRHGVLCQDASRLTFADASFDVVISQDIMEHMDDPWRGFDEIARVLRPGGRHIFTVPLHEGERTRPRAALRGGKVRHILPPVFHKDPLDPDGALVFWDYGDDLPDLLKQRGIEARMALHTAFYDPAELCRVGDDEDWRRCREACEHGGQVSFFLYNSVVFVAGPRAM